ncbi:MAG: NfeD family protein [Clostridia bacterium]|nr:NfeD family protein [Clostridia bacterium]
MVYLWLTVIILSLIIEASTSALVAIWFIPSAIVSAVIARLGGGVIFQVTVFFILSILLVVFARKILSRTLVRKTVPTNADALVGERGVVIDEIDNLGFRGVVKVKGQTWSARSENGERIEVGKSIEVLSIEGVKLIVKTL